MGQGFASLSHMDGVKRLETQMFQFIAEREIVMAHKERILRSSFLLKQTGVADIYNLITILSSHDQGS
jgi:hypothetical protein